MLDRVLKVAANAALVGSLLAVCGCGPDVGRAGPEAGGPETGGPGQGEPGQAADGPALGQPRDQAAQADGNVSDDEVILVVDDGAEIHDDCGNRKVVVSADEATVVLDGDCGLVRVTGRGSVIEVGTADKIVLAGVDNKISFASGEPEVINQGRNTTVSEGGDARH